MGRVSPAASAALGGSSCRTQLGSFRPPSVNQVTVEPLVDAGPHVVDVGLGANPGSPARHRRRHGSSGAASAPGGRSSWGCSGDTGPPPPKAARPYGPSLELDAGSGGKVRSR